MLRAGAVLSEDTTSFTPIPEFLALRARREPISRARKCD
jgi:hypothetical protein